MQNSPLSAPKNRIIRHPPIVCDTGPEPGHQNRRRWLPCRDRFVDGGAAGGEEGGGGAGDEVGLLDADEVGG